jgi:transcriptional regulator with XRE-family HTH domain
MSIHQRIKERRIAMGFTSHKAFGLAVDVSWQTVQLWEKEGGTAPNRSRIDQVAKVLGVTKEWLQYGSTEDERKSPEGYSPNPVPPWCAPEAFRLLELFYQCDPRRREDILDHVAGVAAVVNAESGRNKAKL